MFYYWSLRQEEIPEHKIIQKLDTYGFSFFFQFYICTSVNFKSFQETSNCKVLASSIEAFPYRKLINLSFPWKSMYRLPEFFNQISKIVQSR